MQQRAVVLVVVLATVSCFLVDAAAAAAASSSRALAAAQPRSLLQDALSNSNGCLATIPTCEPGACAVRNVLGQAKWVCLRCSGNYKPVVDASGQDNIVQCVCPKGFYEASAGATSCTRCPANSYCPGGDLAENPASRGSLVTCGTSLVTRNTGARSQADCVAPKGYAMTSATAATPCGTSEYAPLFNRLGRCLRCQSGLQEDLSANLTAGERDSKRTVCKVPPGRYMSQGLVRICPQGFYREAFREFSDPMAQRCVACNSGITTEGPGAGLASQCNRVLPGYGVSAVFNVSSNTQTAPLYPQANATGLPAATICELGFYSFNGYCAACPSATVTTRLGAQAIEECMVPPGYFVSAGSMAKCGNGTFRQEWAMHSDPKAQSCSACGTGIASEAREVDANPLAAAGSLVRATSAACYIEAGQGMIADGKNKFAGKDCPANTYGAAGVVYGLTSAPCKPCPRNMGTDGAVKVTDAALCINPAGFGMASEGASRCDTGFYAAKGSRKPCQRCPFGRTTVYVAEAQQFITDCFVLPGFGVVNSNANSSNAFAANTSGLSAVQAAALPVLECPVGFWSAGNSVAAQCVQCPAGSSTEQPGSVSADACSVCMPGFGKAAVNATECSPCATGFYNVGGKQSCDKCPDAKFYPPVDGVGDVWRSAGLTTFPGATGEESCVPKESELSPESGQAFFDAEFHEVHGLLTTASAGSLAACLALCPATSSCMMQYHVKEASCKYAPLTPVAADTAGYKLLYKLPPSTMSAASSVPAAGAAAAASSSSADSTDSTDSSSQVVKAKMLSSGIYARVAIVDATRGNWLLVGHDLDTSARTYSTAAQASLWVPGSEASCKSACDNSNPCWGFFYNGTSCLFKGAIDALGVRSFFVLPGDTDLSPFNWQGATALDAAVGVAVQLAHEAGLVVNKTQVVAALVAGYAATGVYDPKAVVQSLIQQQQPPTQQPQNGSLPLPPPQPAPPAMSLAEAVAKLQRDAVAAGLATPTYADAVMLLTLTTHYGTFDFPGALLLLETGLGFLPEFLRASEHKKAPYYSGLQAFDALLGVYTDKQVWQPNQAVQRLEYQRTASGEVLLSVLGKGLVVSQQQALDGVIATYVPKKGDAAAAAEWLMAAAGTAKDVCDKVAPGGDAAGCAAQATSLLASLYVDSSTFEADTAVKLLVQTYEASKDVVAKAAGQGLALSEQQAADLLLLDYSPYTRTVSVDWADDKLPQLLEAFKQVVESAKAAEADAVDVLLAVCGRVGSFDVAEGTEELQMLPKVLAKAAKAAAAAGVKASDEALHAAIVSLWGKTGFVIADAAEQFAEASVAYLQLSKR